MGGGGGYRLGVVGVWNKDLTQHRHEDLEDGGVCAPLFRVVGPMKRPQQREAHLALNRHQRC